MSSKPFVTEVDTEQREFDTQEAAEAFARSEIISIEREATDGADESLIGGIRVMQVIAQGGCDNPGEVYHTRRYSLKEVISTPRELELESVLRLLNYELHLIEDTEANASVNPEVEDSFWMAGNVTQTLMTRVKEALDNTVKLPAVDRYQRQQALILMRGGWKVRLSETSDKVRWHGPVGQTDPSWESDSIDCPPQAVIDYDKELRGRS